MSPPSHFIALCVATLLLASCGQSPSMTPPSTPRAVQPPEEAPEGQAEVAKAPTMEAGSLVGATLAGVGVPRIEQGLRGALQALPELRYAPPKKLVPMWMGIKRDANVHTQHRRLKRMTNKPVAASTLIDLRALEGAGLPPFGHRDRVRGRTWVTRTMAAVLITAWGQFHRQHPSARLTLGDLAQPWGGSIFHNALVRRVEGVNAEELLDAAQLIGGRFVVDAYRLASDFASELGRFESPGDAVWLRHELTARLKEGSTPTLRTSTHRYTFPHTPEVEERGKAFATLASIAKRGARVESTIVRHVGEDGLTEDRWRDHWVDSKRRRQLVTLSRREQGERLQMRWVDSARVANWQQRKPGSFPKEHRWMRSAPDAQGRTSWTRWQAMREAGHVSHMGGSDADISFVTAANSRHFAVDLSVFDARRTWAWFQALYAAAAALGTSLDVVLISSPIIRALESQLTRAEKRSPLWRALIRRAPGHDAHHHLRLAAPSQDSDARARAVLLSLAGP
jgi:hypothetical protein